MKTKEIVLNGVYSNGKGRIRKIIAEGAEYGYDTQHDRDCIRYEVINDGTKKNATGGWQCNMTRNAFASWAKEQL